MKKAIVTLCALLGTGIVIPGTYICQQMHNERPITTYLVQATNKDKAIDLCVQETGWKKNKINLVQAGSGDWERWQQADQEAKKLSKSTKPAFFCTWLEPKGPFMPMMHRYVRAANKQEAEKLCMDAQYTQNGGRDLQVTPVTQQEYLYGQLTAKNAGRP